MKTMTVEKEYPYNPIGSWGNGDPFTIAFVYPRNGKNFIVKGGRNDVNCHIETFAKTEPCIVHLNYYRKGEVRAKIIHVLGLRKGLKGYIRDGWPVENGLRFDENWKIVRVRRVRNVRRKHLRVSDRLGNFLDKELRRVPRGWMKELDPFIAYPLVF